MVRAERLDSPSAYVRTRLAPEASAPAAAASPAILGESPLVRVLREQGLDGFGRTRDPRAAQLAPAALPALDPAQARALLRELGTRAAAAPTPDMLRAAAPGGVSPPPPAPDGLTVGDRGRAVRRAEQRLKRAGFDVGKVDGVFDAQTARAVSRFQAATARGGEATTGVLDDRTANRLQAVDARIRRDHGKTLGVGQHGRRVLEAERRLDRLGYDVGKVDGTYDRATGRALQAFRHDQGWVRGGTTMGRRAQDALADETRALAHDPQRVRVRPSRARRQQDQRVAAAAARTHADGQVGIGEGTPRGNVVRTVQQHLRAAGYDPKHTDGRFDERTRGALEQFQRRSGLPVTGRVDRKTWAELKDATLEARSSFSPPQRVGERSSAVRRTERLLAKLGYDPGKVDGVYTEATQRAVDKLRRKAHLGSEGGGVSARVNRALVKAVEEKQEGHATALGRRLAKNGRAVALGMNGYTSGGRCAAGVSEAIERTMGIKVWGNGNQIDNNLPRSRFREVHMSLKEALKIPGLVLTWERTSTTLGQRYGHTAITAGDGHTSTSDFIETNTLAGSSGRSGLRIFMPIR